MKMNLKHLLISSMLVGTLMLGTSVFAEEATETTMTSETMGEEKIIESTEAIETSQTSTSESSETAGVNPEVIDSEKVEATVSEVVGEKVGADVPIETNPEASEIRTELSKKTYGISKEDLDKYTDEQLEETMTLFTRYNYDIIGMDYGSYARLLITLYVDKTVNVNDALTQLSFDPAGFNSYSAMIPQVEELQIYLRTLYPINSSFLPGVERTTEALIAKLESLQVMEDELTAEGKGLPFGRIAPLIQADDFIGEEITKSTETENSTTVSSEVAQVTATSSSSDKKGSFLPQTNESGQTWFISMIGLIGLFVAASVFKMTVKNK